MPNLMPSDIMEEVRVVLLSAHTGKGSERQFMSAYQILNLMPVAIRDRLINERSIGGLGTGEHYSAASVVADTAQLLKAEIVYMNTTGTQVNIAGIWITPGYPVCGLYRL